MKIMTAFLPSYFKLVADTVDTFDIIRQIRSNL